MVILTVQPDCCARSVILCNSSNTTLGRILNTDCFVRFLTGILLYQLAHQSHSHWRGAGQMGGDGKGVGGIKKRRVWDVERGWGVWRWA